MAGDYYYPEAVDAPNRMEKVLKTFIILATLCMGGIIVWLFAITPFRPFLRIDISGFDRLEKSEILAIAGISSNASFFSTNAAAVERSLMQYAAFESARVFKHFPDRLQIVLEGRRPVASAFAVVHGLTVPVMIDRHGVIFQVGADERGLPFPAAMPVISGLIIEEPFPGMRLPLMFTSLFQSLENIIASDPELLLGLSEIRINRRAFDGFDLVLYPVHRRIRVRLSALNADILRYALLMVDVLAANESGINTLDFRSGIASYIYEGAHSE